MIPERLLAGMQARGEAIAIQVVMQPMPPETHEQYSEPRTLAMWAAAFQISTKTMLRWFRDGQVVAVRVGGMWRVAKRDVPV